MIAQPVKSSPVTVEQRAPERWRLLGRHPILGAGLHDDADSRCGSCRHRRVYWIEPDEEWEPICGRLLAAPCRSGCEDPDDADYFVPCGHTEDDVTLIDDGWPGCASWTAAETPEAR